MIANPENLALAEELSEICGRRGHDLALTDALAEEQRQAMEALDELTARLDMDARILACLQEHREHLRARRVPWGRQAMQDWDRLLSAFAAYAGRTAETAAQVALFADDYRSFLRKLVTLAREGVI